VSPRFNNKPQLAIQQVLKPSEIEGKPIQNIFDIKKPMSPVIAEPSPRFGVAQKLAESNQKRPWSRQGETEEKKEERNRNKAIEEIKQRGKLQTPMRKFEVIWAEPKNLPKSPLNVFKDDDAAESGLPEFGAGVKEETKDASGFELKNYIKEMNKFLDEPATKNRENQQNTEESDDDEYEEDLPKVSEESRP
jgi:hypothetical protein